MATNRVVVYFDEQEHALLSSLAASSVLSAGRLDTASSEW
jgi:hypothetical protein